MCRYLPYEVSNNIIVGKYGVKTFAPEVVANLYTIGAIVPDGMPVMEYGETTVTRTQRWVPIREI